MTRELLQQKLSRRDFLALSAGFSASVLSGDRHEFPVSLESLSDRGYVGVAHNAAVSPERLLRYLSSNVPVIEIDSLFYEGEMMVGHSISQFDALPDFVKDSQRFENVVKKVTQALKVPAFDVKFESDDTRACGQFRSILRGLETESAIVFGKEWGLLDMLGDEFENIQIAYTLDTSERLGDFLGHIKSYPDRKAVSLRNEFAIPSVVERLKEEGKSIFVWTVNDPGRVLALEGVDAIISDNYEILDALSANIYS